MVRMLRQSDPDWIPWLGGSEEWVRSPPPRHLTEEGRRERLMSGEGAVDAALLFFPAATDAQLAPAGDATSLSTLLLSKKKKQKKRK